MSALVAATRNAPRRHTAVTPVFTAYTARMMLAETILQSNFISAESLAGPIVMASPQINVKTMRKKEVGFQILTGSANQLNDALNAGATGGILALAACAPQACQEIYTAWMDNDPTLAAGKQQRVVEASKVVLAKFGIPGIKHSCDLNGYYGGRPRLPLLPLDAAQQAEVARAIADLRN